MVAFLTVRSVVVSFAFRGGSAFCDGAACVVSDDDAVPAMVPSLLRRLLARAENTKGPCPFNGSHTFSQYSLRKRYLDQVERSGR